MPINVVIEEAQFLGPKGDKALLALADSIDQLGRVSKMKIGITFNQSVFKGLLFDRRYEKNEARKAIRDWIHAIVSSTNTGNL